MVMIGEGRVTYQVETLDGAEALKRAGLKPVVLSSKEGLILLSGTRPSPRSRRLRSMTRRRSA